VDLGDRVLGPTFRAEPVGAREEVRFEDRLQDQFERGLHHPVRGGGDPQGAQLPAAFGDYPFPHRQSEGRALFDTEPVPVTRYRYRGTAIPTPWTPQQVTTTLVG
jgi:hypothetical protein